MLQMLGARVDEPAAAAELNGIAGLCLWPRVAWAPLFAATFDDLEARVNCPGVHLGSDTALVITAPAGRIQSLDLRRGALVIEGGGGGGGSSSMAVIDGLVVDNDGWEWKPLHPDEGATEEEFIRRDVPAPPPGSCRSLLGAW
jgi:hypothetical protein